MIKQVLKDIIVSKVIFIDRKDAPWEILINGSIIKFHNQKSYWATKADAQRALTNKVKGKFENKLRKEHSMIISNEEYKNIIQSFIDDGTIEFRQIK
jgi:hypothetical protein